MAAPNSVCSAQLACWTDSPAMKEAVTSMIIDPKNTYIPFNSFFTRPNIEWIESLGYWDYVSKRTKSCKARSGRRVLIPGYKYVQREDLEALQSVCESSEQTHRASDLSKSNTVSAKEQATYATQTLAVSEPNELPPHEPPELPPGVPAELPNHSHVPTLSVPTPSLLSRSSSKSSHMLARIDTQTSTPPVLNCTQGSLPLISSASTDQSVVDTDKSLSSAVTAPSPYSPVSTLTLSSGRDSPVILLNDRQRWVFPKVSVEQIVSRTKADGFSVEPLTDDHGRKRAAAGSPDLPSASQASPTGSSGSRKNQAKKQRLDQGPSNDQENAPGKGSSKTASPPVRRFGCPFTKHDPERYSKVFNCCTHNPGIKWRSLIEHIERIHLPNKKCLYCSVVWATKNWEAEQLAHLESGLCTSPEERLKKPEFMTAAQAAVYKDMTSEQSTPESKAVALYMRLFPGAYPIPDPHYSYYVATHRISSPSNSNSSSPISPDGTDNSPTSEWYLLAQRHRAQNVTTTSTPIHDGSAHFNHIFNFHPTANNTSTTSGLSVGAVQGPMHTIHQQSFASASVPWQHSSSANDQTLYAMRESAYMDPMNSLLMPGGHDDGLTHFDKWIGQNTATAVDETAPQPAYGQPDQSWGNSFDEGWDDRET